MRRRARDIQTAQFQIGGDAFLGPNEFAALRARRGLRAASTIPRTFGIARVVRTPLALAAPADFARRFRALGSMFTGWATRTFPSESLLSLGTPDRRAQVSCTVSQQTAEGQRAQRSHPRNNQRPNGETFA